MSISGKMKRGESLFRRRVVVIPVKARKELFADEHKKHDAENRQDPRKIRERRAGRWPHRPESGYQPHASAVAARTAYGQDAKCAAVSWRAS